MNLYQRDYSKGPTKEEIKEYEKILEEEKLNMPKFGKRNFYHRYPESIRHYNSLFPNNHIDLYDWKKSKKMPVLTDEFNTLVHDSNSKEQQILNFINHKPAHYIIGSLLIYRNFGHQGTYIFPEFSIGSGKYYADFLVVGKNSGGYEFAFVELEAPNGKTTLESGHDGLATRKGLNQIMDWKRMIEMDFASVSNEFKKLKKDESIILPVEFQRLDTTRIHYIVVSGLREHYNDVTYYERRIKAKEQNVEMYHYDNLVEFAKSLEQKTTF